MYDFIFPLPAIRQNSPNLIFKIEQEKKQSGNNDGFVFFQHFLAPVCRQIETDLRLHIHQHLQVGDRNPFRVRIRLAMVTRTVYSLKSPHRRADCLQKVTESKMLTIVSGQPIRSRNSGLTLIMVWI